MTRKKQIGELFATFMLFGFGVIGVRVTMDYLINRFNGCPCNCMIDIPEIISSSFLGSLFFTAFTWYYKRWKISKEQISQ